MTNYGTLEILALPKMPERQLRFLLALETITCREDGRREVGIDLLAKKAGLSVNTAVRARRDLVKSGAIEYRRGDGRGHLSTYRIKVPINDVHLPEPEKVPSDTDHLSSPGKVPSDTDHLPSPERYPNRPRKGTQTGPVKVPKRNAATSGNASGGLEPYGLEPSGLPAPTTPATRARAHARDPRLICAGLGADEAETDFILATIEADPRIPDTAEWLLTETGEGRGGKIIARARRALAAARRDRRRTTRTEAERRRQHDELNEFIRQQPEADSTS